MIALFWLLTALIGGDPCAPSVEPPRVEVDPRSMEIKISRTYGIPWAVCAQEKGSPAPRLRVTAKDGTVLLDKEFDAPSLHEGTRTFSASASACKDRAPDRREPNAVLQGPVGRRRWYNRRTVDVALIAEGAFAPLAFRQQVEVLCRACSDGASTSYYVNDFDKGTARMVISVDKPHYECSKGGGRIMMRRYWTAPGAEQWAPLRPYEVLDNLQDRLKPQGESMMYEAIEPMARFCKPGKSNLYEFVGVDEYSVLRRSYGPSEGIQRGSIEFLRCK